MTQMAEARPDPDQLLERIKTEEARARHGHLRIFFGASAGVGKTYAMLEAARGMHSAGTDVVVGYVEPHGRLETERLLMLTGLGSTETAPYAMWVGREAARIAGQLAGQDRIVAQALRERMNRAASP